MSGLLVDSLRQPWESDEHWLLRKEFIEHYKDDFDEDRLMCLAQVYTNMELLGCTYPDAVMIQVHELANGLKRSEDLKKARKQRADMKFVKSSEQQNNSGPKKRRSESSISCSKKKTSDPSVLSKKFKKDFITFDSGKTQLSSIENSSNKSLNSNVPSNISSSNADSHQDSQVSNVLDKKRMLLKIGNLAYELITKKRTPNEALNNAAQKFGIPVQYDVDFVEKPEITGMNFQCKLSIVGVLLAEVFDQKKKNSKSKAAEQAINNLRQQFRVVQKDNGCFVLNFESAPLHQEQHPVATPNAKEEFKPLESAVQSSISHSNNMYSEIDASVIKDFGIMDYSQIRNASSIVILSDSATFCHVSFQYEFTYLEASPVLKYKCQVLLRDSVIGEAFGSSRQESKHAAADAALNRLKKCVWTVQIKADSDAVPVSRDQVMNVSGPVNPLPESNIGCKMLKMMGWSGGGIGKAEQSGILEPVSSNNRHGLGQGLGYESSKGKAKDFVTGIEAFIQSYAQSNTTSDLIFSSEFSKEERKTIHRIATKYSLKSTSRGQDEDRFLTVSRRFSWPELVKVLLQAGGSTKKYELIKPGSVNIANTK